MRACAFAHKSRRCALTHKARTLQPENQDSHMFTETDIWELHARGSQSRATVESTHRARSEKGRIDVRNVHITCSEIPCVHANVRRK